MPFTNGSQVIIADDEPATGSAWPRNTKTAIATDTTASSSPFFSSPHGTAARSSR